MGRIIATGDTPAKRRHAHLRSCAEVLRLLATRETFDPEARDMAAFLAFSLRGIEETIEDSAASWEDRQYWRKAEKLRHRWGWARRAADELETCILTDHWHEIPPLMVTLLPHLEHITINAVTRDADWWCGALRALKRTRQTA